MRYEVYLQRGTAERRLRVPQQSVLEDMQGRYVFVVGDGDVVDRRNVSLGQREGTRWVVESGLEAGDRVIELNGEAGQFLGLLVDDEWLYRENRKLTTRLKVAKFKEREAEREEKKMRELAPYLEAAMARRIVVFPLPEAPNSAVTPLAGSSSCASSAKSPSRRTKWASMLMRRASPEIVWSEFHHSPTSSAATHAAAGLASTRTSLTVVKPLGAALLTSANAAGVSETVNSARIAFFIETPSSG